MMTAKHEDATPPMLETRYAIGDLLGQGAVGFVYSARDVVLGIDVAVKIMRHELASSPSIVERFRREADVAARMLSPHVVKVLGLAVTRTGAPCIVYEQLKGETLAARIAREGSLSLADTADIVKQTARALARAHALGVIHHDVKPDNIFLVERPDGRPLVKLLDFGVAEMALPSRGPSAVLAGTPEYMAPEVLFGLQAPDARADLYALGVVAFECLTGACPFPGENVQEVIVRVGGGNRASLLDLRPDLHLEIDEWMERALAPDPFWRFASAKELGDAIEGLHRAARPARNQLRRAA